MTAARTRGEHPASSPDSDRDSARLSAQDPTRATAAVARNAFEYCVIRVVPRVERGDSVNVGVIVYCQARDFLDARARLNRDLVLALDPAADLPGIEAAVAAYACVCRGGRQAGQAGAATAGQRFRWLTAPRSTVVQPGPVHLGLTDDPAADLARLTDRLLPPGVRLGGSV